MVTGGPVKLEEGEVSVDDLHFELMSLRSEYDNLTRVNQLYQLELNRTEDQVQQVTELTAKLNDKLESYKYADLEEKIKEEDETLKQLKSKLKEVTKLQERKDKEVRKMRRKLETTTAKERILKENKIMATKVTLLQAGLKVLEGMKEKSSLEETQDEEDDSDEEPEVTLYPAWVQEDEVSDESDKSSVKVQKEGPKKKKRATTVKSVTDKSCQQQKNRKKKRKARKTMKD